MPLALFDQDLPVAPINLAVTSSTINLGLLSGLTDVMRNVAGTLQINVTVIGTSADPHFDGSVQIANASFLVRDSGAKYKNTRAAFTLTQDRVTVESLHVEDNNGRRST